MKNRIRKITISASAACLVLCLVFCVSAHAYGPEDIIGTAPSMISILDTDPEIEECMLGKVIADALRHSTGADIAVVNGGDIQNDLSAGEVRWEDVRAVFYEDRRVALTKITPAGLKDLLETSVSHIVFDADQYIDRAQSAYGGFVQVSGLTFIYDTSAPLYERVVSIALSDGTALDPADGKTVLTLAATEYMLNGAYGYEPVGSDKTDTTLAGALAEYISASGGGFPDTSDRRIKAIGSAGGSIVETVSRPVLAVVCIALAVLFPVIRRKRQDLKDLYGNGGSSGGQKP